MMSAADPQEERKGEEPTTPPEGNNEGQNPNLKFSHNPKMWPDGEDSESGTGSPRMGLGSRQ